MAADDVLVITGGAGGMGLACARELADRGRLLLVDLGEDQLEAARTALTAEGASVETLRCDVTSPADTAAFISGCDIRVDGGLVGAGKHMLGVG